MNAFSFAISKPTLLVTFTLLCCYFNSPNKAQAQTLGPIPELAVEFAPYFFYDLDQEAFYSQILYSKVASSSQVAPELKSTGIVQTIFMSIGTRTTNFEDYDFRWRLGLLNMDVIRLPLSMGVTLFDYDKSNRMELDLRWVNLRLGPSVYFGNPSNYFTLRAIGSIGLTTAKFGDFAYEGLASAEGLSLRKRSYEVGYLGETFLFFANKFIISGTYSHRHILGGIRPKIYAVKGILGVRVNSNVTIHGSYSIEATKAGQSTLDNSFVGFGLGLLI